MDAAAARAPHNAMWKTIHRPKAKLPAANVKACTSGIGILNGGRGGTTIPSSDRKGVYNHLAKHLRDAGEDPAALK